MEVITAKKSLVKESRVMNVVGLDSAGRVVHGWADSRLAESENGRSAGRIRSQEDVSAITQQLAVVFRPQ